MQHCSILVALGGDKNNVTLIENASVAAIAVFIGTSGLDGVSRVSGTTTESPITHLAEYDRLCHAYGTDAVAKAFGPRTFNLSLPTRLSAVFADVADEPEAEEIKPAGPTKRAGIKLAMKSDDGDELSID